MTTAIELSNFAVEGKMLTIGEVPTLSDGFSIHLTLYTNGFCKSAQIDWAIDNDMEPSDLVLWHQRISGVQMLVQEHEHINQITLYATITFVAFEEEGKQFIDIPEEVAADMAQASIYSFLHSYRIFYG
jgi:hypothetical protein